MIQNYLHNINLRYNLGNATEHTFRGDLQHLIENLNPGIRATNEPKRQKCGAPDYILTRKDITVGFIEAKDIGDTDLNGLKKTGNKEQFDRYKASLNNLMFTDYLNFHFYRDGQLVNKVVIGEVTSKGIRPLTDNFQKFEELLHDFCTTIGLTIKSSKRLAEMMAGKARLLSDVIEKSLTSDETHHEDSTLKDQMNAFKQVLIHDITPKSFADVYAQTIAYGLFAARSHDPSLPTFSRQEAFELIPKSNPFLKKLFGYIAGLEVDDRIKWIVDDLVQIFLACDVAYLLKDYGKGTRMEDPIIHFYEDFLCAYDPALRKARGVWYTPQPVVNFIVRAVDDILKTEFGLPQGLADTSKAKIKVDIQGKKVEQEVHKVQILDPATGTGTFLAEVVKLIHKRFEGQQGIWSNYVENHLLPRLNGFELLMASYAMAHLKLDLLLSETGYKPTKDQRLRVYLTNSLEEHHPDTDTLFANWLSTEANEANRIKRDTPVMCIIGNPPYSVSSTNKGKWIVNLTSDYKRGLKEKNIQPLSDDYIKFLRLGQHYIDKNGSGVLAYISNNSFIDGIIHREMRKSLLESFNSIYILDLHGNAQKKETCADGSVDQNVFDIMQGVSINIFVKKVKSKNKGLGQVYHADLYGKRELKYETLVNSDLSSINWNLLQYSEPQYFFVKKDFKSSSSYEEGFKVDEIFIHNNTGLNTEFDELAIQDNKKESVKVLEILKTKTANEIITLLSLNHKKLDKIEQAILDIKNNNSLITGIKIKPFEDKSCIYTGKSNGIMGRPRHEIMKHLLGSENLSLISMRQYAYDVPDYCYTFVSRRIVTSRLFMSNKGYCSVFPLYLLNSQELSKQSKFEPIPRVSNLNNTIVQQIANKLNLVFIDDDNLVCDLAPGTAGTLYPLDILDYIYAVLHSPTYRENYKEFLKIDFPRIPYPKDLSTFRKLTELGSEIRQIHLLESPVVEQYITQYPIDGSNEVTKLVYIDGKVYINDSQYFNNVPQIAWNFYIGGYQPAQKWLKDRKGRKLQFEDIQHYQKIIVALTETDRLMKEIDKVDFL